MPAPKEIHALVERFHQSIEAYTSGQYNETQLRREFLDPLFTALGWDVENKQGYAEAYKDIVHEDSIKIGTATKAPDYSFRIGGVRKFFVEAKKPSTDVKEEVAPAFQLRRYAWSAKLPLSILTDFEEFAVYDCRIKPRPSDKSSVGRVLYFKYTEYIDKWDEITAIFSREAVLKGSFDKYVESTRGKRGTAEVDDAFLEEIEEWRELLAKNVAASNPKLSVRDLNFAVQRTIDRTIFLRICEDRGIETYGTLLGLVNGTRIYKRLCEIFYRADEKYNSGLFHFQQEKDRAEPPDEFTPGLELDDEPLRNMIKSLYYPDSSYEFSVLPADILGQVYEQFLGKVIRLTAGHQAKVEDKPEVKKAGGVYYTPTYIVDYIVKNTVGKLLRELESKDKSAGKRIIKGVSKLRILDPACGSGSFLIGAYQYLLNWHRDWYVNDGPENWATGKNPTLYQAQGGEWRLTAAERKRILLNNIYGVDIDHQAVEVTKLSLLLKVLEGENEQTISRQLKMFHQRALPDLANNIKRGNSLIGPDFYEGRQLSLMDDDERIKINAFDWKSEFKEIMEAGGFDAVIGNPPYVRQESIGEFKDYFERVYKTFQGMADLYTYFIEQGVNLLRSKGYFSYIVANKWMRSNYGEPLRKWLKSQALEEIIDFGDLPIFQAATTYPCILRVSKAKTNDLLIASRLKTLKFVDLSEHVEQHSFMIPKIYLDDSGWTLTDTKSKKLLDKLQHKGMPLGEYVQGRIYYGIKTGLNEAFVIDAETRKQIIKEDKRSTRLIRPFLAGRDIKKYRELETNKYLILLPKGFTNEQSGKESDKWKWLVRTYPSIAKHLKPFEKQAEKRYDKGDYWWELRACDYYQEFEKPKILLPDISLRGNFMLDTDKGVYCVNTAYMVCSDERYLLGILNSKLITFFYQNLSAEYRGGYLRFIYQYLIQLPIHTLDISNGSDKSYHDRMVSLVETMLDLHKRLAAAKTEQDQTPIKRQIEATDKQIDELVYELYGLTEEEKKIVEGN